MRNNAKTRSKHKNGRALHCSADFQSAVSQLFKLPGNAISQRLLILKRSFLFWTPCRLQVGDTADLEICATPSGMLLLVGISPPARKS
jgi:hypothetical protein